MTYSKCRWTSRIIWPDEQWQKKITLLKKQYQAEEEVEEEKKQQERKRNMGNLRFSSVSSHRLSSYFVSLLLYFTSPLLGDLYIKIIQIWKNITTHLYTLLFLYLKFLCFHFFLCSYGMRWENILYAFSHWLYFILLRFHILLIFIYLFIHFRI